MSVEPRGALSSVATGKTGAWSPVRGLYVEPWEAERLQPRTSLEKKPKETSPKRNFSSFSAATGDRGAYALRPLQSRYRRDATGRARLDALDGGILSSVILLIYAAAAAIIQSRVRENGVFSAVVNGGVEDSVMGSGLP